MILPGPVSFTISEGDYHALNALMFRRTWGRCLVLGLLAAAVVAVPVAWVERSLLLGIGLILVGLAAGTIYILAMRLFLRPRGRKVYRESASLQEEMTVTVDQDGLHVEQASGSYHAQWRKLVRWDENEAVFALFPNRIQALIFPKHEVGKEVVDFMRKQMKISGLPRPWRLRK